MRLRFSEKVLKVSYSNIEEAFVYGSYELQVWLDAQTGEVIFAGEARAEAKGIEIDFEQS
jgi:hypothetical protein